MKQHTVCVYLVPLQRHLQFVELQRPAAPGRFGAQMNI